MTDVRYDLLALLTQPGDAECHGVAAIEVRGRVHAQADARGRAGRYDISRLQAHELTDVAHQVVGPEYHG